ncbi:type II toxin-antitoxin system RelE/ParE family toxin [Maridesulfovibrio sp.]|uniref:type II toxin-antitoxin system RelE/ParE family toxin n=1 Tax=Maridesulfovibrio sp. TaxID=2795000 RepID=UPI0029C9B468|nr:type II toxin-antitoxin system RelE/ParE family toxin [Maridesulfovibrio sp.]
MEWEIILCDEFEDEFLSFGEKLQDELIAQLNVLSKFGPSLGRPQVDSIKESKFSNMKELRFSFDKQPHRYFFAFDPLRRAIVLVGGSKANDKKFYKRMIPIADKRFEQHLKEQGDS